MYVFSLAASSLTTLDYQPLDVTMPQNNPPPLAPFKPNLRAVWRSVASSTALETGQSVKQLEQKLQNSNQHRFAQVKP
jgi:hypothetical protein